MGDTQGDGKAQIDITPFELKNSGAIEKLVQYFMQDNDAKISLWKVQEFAVRSALNDESITGREISLAIKKFV